MATRDAQIRDHFQKCIQDYDTVSTSVVMKADEMSLQVISSVPTFSERVMVKVLDLCCGTGSLISDILSDNPNALAVGVDYADLMVKKARSKLSRFDMRSVVLQDDVRNLDLKWNFDAVISMVSIHNLSHLDQTELFKRVFTLLNEGGVFINADFFVQESEEEEAQVKTAYLDYVKGNLKGAELEHWLNHIALDSPMKLSDQFRILTESGFLEPRVIWRYLNQAVYIAEKPIPH